MCGAKFVSKWSQSQVKCSWEGGWSSDAKLNIYTHILAEHRGMSKRAGSKVVETKGGHAVYVSQPKVSLLSSKKQRSALTQQELAPQPLDEEPARAAHSGKSIRSLAAQGSLSKKR